MITKDKEIIVFSFIFSEKILFVELVVNVLFWVDELIKQFVFIVLSIKNPVFFDTDLLESKPLEKPDTI